MTFPRSQEPRISPYQVLPESPFVCRFRTRKILWRPSRQFTTGEDLSQGILKARNECFDVFQVE